MVLFIVLEEITRREPGRRRPSVRVTSRRHLRSRLRRIERIVDVSYVRRIALFKGEEKCGIVILCWELSIMPCLCAPGGAGRVARARTRARGPIGSRHDRGDPAELTGAAVGSDSARGVAGRG